MKPKLYLIIGLAKHGKTEVGKAIARAFHLEFGDTSEIVYRSLADRLADTTVYKALSTSPTEIEMYLRSAPKELIRPLLIQEGDRLCASTPSALTLGLVNRGCRVVAGIRRRSEFLHAIGVLQFQYDIHVWWVQRYPAPPAVPDNTEVRISDAHYLFVNDHPHLAALQFGVTRVLLNS